LLINQYFDSSDRNAYYLGNKNGAFGCRALDFGRRGWAERLRARMHAIAIIHRSAGAITNNS
jgi:hypothetical protein